jgi:polyphenol oxidase
LKSIYPSEVPHKTVILPALFFECPEICSGMSTKLGDGTHTDFGMNLSYRVGDDSDVVDRNRKTFFSSVGLMTSQLAIPVQTHSDTVLKVDQPGEYEHCDALVTNSKGVALTVTVADCVPILLFDPIQKAIAAVHAGWKGTAKEITRRAVEKMQVEFESDPKNILAYIGPCAAVCCYEVGLDVAVKFNINSVPYERRRIFIDLKKENAAQLLQQGVKEESIEISPHCTICENEVFHSHRRDGKNSGRMMAFICLKSS